MNETAVPVIPLLIVFGSMGVQLAIGIPALKKAKLSYGWLWLIWYPVLGSFAVFGVLLRVAKLKDKYFTQIDGYSVNLKHGLIKCTNCDRVKKLGKSKCDKCKEPLPTIIKCKECGSKNIKLHNKYASKITITGIILMFAISFALNFGDMILHQKGGPNSISTILYIVGTASAVLFLIDMHMYGVFKRLYLRCDSCGAKYPGNEITSIKMRKISMPSVTINQNAVQPVKSYASSEPAYKFSSRGASANQQLRTHDNQVIKCAKCSHEFIWDDAFYQRYTIGANPSNEDFWPRVFCPNCGIMIADWSLWKDDYKWYGNNSSVNEGKHLPAGALDYHEYNVEGKAITKINQYSIDLELANHELNRTREAAQKSAKTSMHLIIETRDVIEAVDATFKAVQEYIPSLTYDEIRNEFTSRPWQDTKLLSGTYDEMHKVVEVRFGEMSLHSDFEFFTVKRPKDNSILILCAHEEYFHPFEIWKKEEKYYVCVVGESEMNIIDEAEYVDYGESTEETESIEEAKTNHDKQNEYIKSCLEQKYKNLEETRSYNEDRFVKIPTMLNNGYNKEAIEQLKPMLKEHPDYDMLYTWQAIAFTRLGNSEKAYEALNKGLKISKQKHSICLELAKIDINKGDIENALYWLSQSILCMQDEPDNYKQIRAQAYLYLVYIAKGFNMPDCEVRYRSIVNMNWYSLDFSNDVSIKIVRNAKNKKDSAMAAVLKRI